MAQRTIVKTPHMPGRSAKAKKIYSLRVMAKGYRWQ